MAEQLDVISLPVVLSEGSERVHVGTVSVHPSVSFRALQSEMSGMIGVPPYQMTAFLERPSRNYRIIPVNEKVLDLTVVAREGAGEWRLLAVVRRPRNERSRRGRRSKGNSRLLVAEDHRKPSQIQPEKIILRRNDAGNSNANASTVYDLMYGPVGVTPVWGPLYSNPPAHEIRSVDGTYRAAAADEKDGVWLWRDAWRAAEPAKAVCAVCDAAAKETDSARAFHCCVRDEILTLTVGSVGRSPVGPIERPSRRRVQQNLGCAA